MGRTRRGVVRGESVVAGSPGCWMACIFFSLAAGTYVACAIVLRCLGWKVGVL